MMFRKRLPPFLHKFDIPAITAGSSYLYAMHDQLRHFRNYAPFPHFYIQNLSAVNLSVMFNYDANTEIIVSAGGYQTRKNQPFCNFRIINDGESGTNTNDVTVWIENIP